MIKPKSTKLGFLTSALFIITIFFSCSSDDDTPANNENDNSLKITSIKPVSGQIGEEITITLNKFVENPKITFNDVNAVITKLNATDQNTIITTRVPINATTGKVKVIVNKQEVLSTSDFEVLATPISDRLSISPMTGKSGSVVKIEIKNILTPLTDLDIYFDGIKASVDQLGESDENGIRSVSFSVRVPPYATSNIISIKSGDNIIIESKENFIITPEGQLKVFDGKQRHRAAGFTIDDKFYFEILGKNGSFIE